MNSISTLFSKLILLLLLSSVMLGCGGNHAPPALADANKSLESLKLTLESWRSGNKPEALREGKPSILVADEDWQAGLRLVSFEVGAASQTGGTAQCIPVVLELEGPAGVQRKTVQYAVNTSPILSVVRQEPQE